MDSVQARHIAIALSAGLVIGAAADSYFFARSVDRVVTEYAEVVKTVEVVKEVEKEKIVWKTQEVEVKVKEEKKSGAYNRYTETAKDGTVRVWENGTTASVATEASRAEKTGEVTIDKSRVLETSRIEDRSITMKQTLEKGDVKRLSLGIHFAPSMFTTPTLGAMTLTGNVRVGNLPVFGSVMYTYPLQFRFGTMIEF
jgi:hypothetical protein